MSDGSILEADAVVLATGWNEYSVSASTFDITSSPVYV